MVYQYKDEQGRLLFEKLRYPNPKKPFGFRVHKDNGKYEYKLGNKRRVLYKLPELMKAPQDAWTFLCEGEKDTDNLVNMGLIAVTNCEGASQESRKSKWRPEYTESLRGRKVVILPDNDGPGRHRAKHIAEALQSVANEVRVVELPGLQEKGDVTDWLDAHDSLEPGALKERLLAEVEKAGPRVATGEWVCMSTVQPEPVTWLCDQYVPMAEITNLVGMGSAGKSTLCAYLAGRVTTGLPFHGVRQPTPKGSVLILCDEESLECGIRPKLDANGADPRMVHCLKSILKPDGKPDYFDITRHLEILNSKIDQLGHVRLLILDPITAYLGRTRANDNAETRAALIGLQDLAREYSLAVVGINHLSKKQDLDLVNRVLGSVAFVNASRSTLGIWRECTEDGKYTGRRMLGVLKSNYAEVENLPTLAYRIEDLAVCFQGETIDKPLDAFVRSQGTQRRGRKEQANVSKFKEWLQERLKVGPLKIDAIQRQAEALGVSQSRMYAAGDSLGVIKDYGSWRLPT